MLRRLPRRPVTVAIIGAGFGGIAAAVKLQTRTSAQVVIFEKAAGVGGTWWHNRYPGCEVDVHSHAYSFSFLKYDWPRTHATQPELLRYAEHVVDAYQLRPCLRLSTEVTLVRWSEAREQYEVHTVPTRGDDPPNPPAPGAPTRGDDPPNPPARGAPTRGDDRPNPPARGGAIEHFDVVISAVGLLSVPRIPDWPGLSDFGGVAFHTAAWPRQLELAGRRVAVVGTGSTAAQVVPEVAAEASRLYVFQREPGWVEPKLERPFTPAERWMYRHVPGAQKAHRAWLFYKAMQRGKAFDARSARQTERRAGCLDFIRSAIADEAVRASVTPDYPWGCKRVVLASTFYGALNRPNVELVPHAVTTVTPTGVVDETGTEREVDVLILATGFQPTNFLAGLSVTGAGGVSLREAWRSRAAAFLGITVAGFPNFFILYGPNTNGAGSIIAQLERQAEFAARAVTNIERGRWRYVDTDAPMQRRYVEWIDQQIARHASAMEADCRNYYHDASGANITQWPSSHLMYLLVIRIAGRRGLRPAAATPRRTPQTGTSA